MALVKFYSMEDSFEAISCLHNEVFSGRKIQISFTKSRIWQWFSLIQSNRLNNNYIKKMIFFSMKPHNDLQRTT
jgi:RNA recognition motif-containing protein